ncbi:MAG: hypothetical protein ACRBB0_27220 [Pelagimonas sp.]|uniref:hypothetical protein n=1 Tax=Pelagimonas sp. TaxID=2073170 RepID=UPI003D6ACEAE
MRRTRSTGVGQEAQKKHRTPKVIHKIRSVGTVSPAYSDGTAVIDMKRGPYTYQNIGLSISSTVSIPDDTNNRTGKFFVKTDKWSKYVSRIRLEIDGVVQRDMTTEMFISFMRMKNLDAANGVLFMMFGGPSQFEDKDVEDAYMLGTRNVNSIRLLFDLTSEWVDGQMQLEEISEYAPVNRPTAFLVTNKVHKRRATGAGQFTISDLPTHADIGAIYVLGAGIKSAKLIVDDIELFDGDNHQLHAMQQLYGRAYDQFPVGEFVMFDFLRSKEVTKGLKSLETKAERRRNADIRLEFDMEDAAELTVVVEQMGPLNSQ